MTRGHDRYRSLRCSLCGPALVTLALAVLASLLSCGGSATGPANPTAAPLASVPTAGPSAAFATLPMAVGVSDLEFIGPFANWVNVRTSFGAVGDGIADDTSAIQDAINALRKYNNSVTGAVTLFFPAGTYRITNTLYMELNSGVNLIGANPTSTTILWNGPAGGTMLRTSGSFDTLFTRLAWDGDGTAAIGIAQWWNFAVDRANYQGSIKHIDEVFRNLGIGIYGGRLGTDYGEGDSETLIERVQFQAMSVAGVNVGSFNAFNWWIWDSTFQHCARGVSNEFSIDDNGPTGGAGNLLVYRSVFQGSTVADLSIANTGWFSLHNNASLGSAQFIKAANAGPNGGAIIVEGNTVLDTTNPVAIDVGNEGPLLLIDNRIRSLAGASGPAVTLAGAGITPARSSRDVYSLGNQYTVALPIALAGSGGRLLATGDSMVDRDAISAGLNAPAAVAVNYHRAVFEVPVGANADVIQSVINAAAASHSDNAIVHIPAGIYKLSHTLVIPALAHVQIAGDSETSQLWWAGASPTGTIMILAGPSYATVRDLGFVGAQATAISVQAADQVGGRIFLEGSSMAMLQVTGLANTRFDAQANSGIAGLHADGVASLVGVSGMGPTWLTGRSNVVATDSWYEGNRADLLRGNSGNYTYLGGEMAPYSHGVLAGASPAAPAIDLSGFSGQVNIIGATLELPSADNGIAIGQDSATSALFFGVAANQDNFFQDTGTSGNAGLVMAKVYKTNVGAADIPDAGRTDAAFVSRGFAQIRSLVWETTPFPHTATATDVRIFRVFTPNTAIGMRVTP